MTGNVEKIFRVRGQDLVYKCVIAITAEAYISTVWRQGSLVASQLHVYQPHTN